MKQKKKKGSIIIEVATFFLIGVLITGLLTYVCEKFLYDNNVKQHTESHASEIAENAKRALTGYPAYEWLIRYWYAHPDELDIEYDAQFGSGTETERKCITFSERHPELQLRYLDTDRCEALPAEDQKLYAEIAYSWLVTDIDQIKQSYNLSFLFCVISEEPYDSQFFLFSGADVGAKRGTNYEEVYPLGHVVSVSESQADAMRKATQNSSHLADAGNYVDCYFSACSFDGHSVLIGLTYDLSGINANVERQTRIGATLAIVNHLALSLICLALIYLFVLRPLKKVQYNIRQYKEEKDSKAVTDGLGRIRSRTEIGRLADDVSDMALEIDSHMDEIRSITAEKERIGTELNLAMRIQMAMLPNAYPAFPERNEFDIYATMDPAKEVGGDFYDFFLIDGDHLCMVIADVSGKGIPAALFMMATKIILANNVMAGKSPAQILKDTNALICSSNREDMFVTVWLGILEIPTGKLTAANAGHEYPVLKRPDGSFELYKDKHGFVIGGMDGIEYKEYELTVEPGSKLFLYTDGIPEATDADGKMFGVGGMLTALNDDPAASPVETLKNVRAAVDGFVKDAEQFDDLTMLCLEYSGPDPDDPEDGAGSPEKELKDLMPKNDAPASFSDDLELEALTENLPEVQAFVGEKLDGVNCPPKARMQLEIAVEEIFVNIANYAYAPDKGNATVRVEVSDEPVTVSITFVDKGVPYDPLKKEDPDVTLSAEEREIGGLGIFMTKKIMDDVVYEYRDGRNILTIKKKLG